MFAKIVLFTKLVPFIISQSFDLLYRFISAKIYSRGYSPGPNPKTIVVIGSSFAGHHCARLLSRSGLSGFRVVVMEKNTHFQFSWVLPRFCVVPGHEFKAFIPLTEFLKSSPPGSAEVIHDEVCEILDGVVRCRSGREVEYAYLVVATGAYAQPPSRVEFEVKEDGIRALKEMQERIKRAKNIVVVGGGAAGVELVGDARDFYQEGDKKFTLVHSRDRVLNTFGPGLSEVAEKKMKDLGVEVVKGERLVDGGETDGQVVLTSGRKITCDCLIKCMGQTPQSQILSGLSPTSISNTGHILVKPTLQIADPNHPEIYACGDIVTTTPTPCHKNARTAVDQATTVADNIAASIRGNRLRNYVVNWVVGGIKLTVGLKDEYVYLQDGEKEAVMAVKSHDLTLRSGATWKYFGCKPFEDNDEIKGKKGVSV